MGDLDKIKKIDSKENTKEKQLSNGLTDVEKQKVAEGVTQTVDEKIDKVEKSKNQKSQISEEAQQAIDYKKTDLNIKLIDGNRQVQVGKSERIRDPRGPEIKEYSIPLLDIKGMDSGEYDIPNIEADKIKIAISNLGEFQTIKIIGCTDASAIESDNAKLKNLNHFNVIKAQYIQSGGEAPSYQNLLQSTQDPQNTILGYTRAMQGVLSLHLSSDDMKKVELGNKLGDNMQDGNERGFEVETNYSEEIERFIEGVVYDGVYDIFGSLNKNNISFSHNSTHRDSVFYTVSNLQFSTQGQFKKTYNDVFRGVKNIVGDNPELEEKAKQQTEKYLNTLIGVCGGKYQNGTWSGGEKISNDMFFMISAVDPDNGILSKSEFTSIMRDGNLSILENKLTSNGLSLKDYIAELEKKYQSNGGKIVGVTKTLGGNTSYLVSPNPDFSEYSVDRKMSYDDYKLLGLYFSIDNK